MLASTFVLALPALASLCLALPEKRAVPTVDVTIYAYGKNISAIPLVWDADQRAIFISEDTTTYPVISFNVSAKGTDAWNATVANTTTSLGSLFLVDGASSFVGVGFVSGNDTLPANATTAGIRLYGSQVVFISGTTLESQFWAQTTEVDGVWALKWNAAGISQENSTPVTLKVKST